MRIAVLGIDLGKNSCGVVGLDATGHVVLERRLRRDGLRRDGLRRDGVVELAAGLPACIVAMEARCGAHHLGRVLREQGHQVRLMSPEYVRPCVKARKNDDRDAEAIAEAAARPTMRFVELKSGTQLDVRSLHRARDRLAGERTAPIGQLRAFLLEPGVTAPRAGAAQAGAAPRGLAGRGGGLAQRADPAAGRGHARRVARAGPPHPGPRRGVRPPGSYG
jgi:transposase